jgi:hypothetical protein
MGLLLWQGGKEAVRASGLSITSRAVLRELVDAAQDRTGLTWCSQANIADQIGCTTKYMTTAMAALRDAGMVSIWLPDHRNGHVPLIFVHPGGIAARALVDIRGKTLPAITSKAVESHLRTGPFTNADIAEVIAWLRGLGALPGTPQLSRGVSHKPPNSVDPHPPTQSARPPQLSRAEPKENQNQTERAAPRPGQPEGPAVAAADRGWASPEAIAAIKAEAARSLAIGAAGDRAA